MADGSVVVASAEHRWLRRNNDRMGWLTTDKIQPSSVYPARSTKLVKPFEPWDEDRSWGGGYLAAALDGEGSFTQTTRDGRQNRMMLTFTQKDNAMLSEVLRLLTERAFRFSVNRSRDDGVTNVAVLGGTREVLRFLGSVRPRRLLGKMRPLSNGQMRGESVEVVESVFMGEQDVIGVQTSTGTLIAEGFATHNSGDPRSARHGSYAGGEGLDHVVLFLCPHESVAARWRATYPGTPAAVVGCPRLDRWHRNPRPPFDPAAESKPTVAVAFHWPNSLCPESQWALPHYRPALPALRDTLTTTGGVLLGHGHPRAWRQLRREWARLGVEPVAHFAEVMDRADLLVVDNSSVAYEFASTGRPVVWLSAPWYRRDVDHGGRFWRDVEGMPHVEHPADLTATVLEVLADPGRSGRARAAMVARTYSHTDGRAAERAAAAITEAATA